MGGECQVSFGICTDEDKWCLAEYPLRWIGRKEGEGVKQVAKAGAAGSQPAAEFQVEKAISLGYTWTIHFPLTSLISTGTPTSCLAAICPRGCLG